MTVREAEVRWNVSRQRINVWLREGRIPDARVRRSGARAWWEIPDDAKKPAPRTGRRR